MAPSLGFPAALTGFLPASWEDALFAGSAFVLGAVVGSFLNVVAYRVPAGRSVIAGRSACPACGHPVRARDNVPILGWILLGGRCRDCGGSIPAGYAIVEVAGGAALALLAIAEIVAWRSTGSSLAILDRVVVLGDWAWLVGWVARSATVLTSLAWALLARAGYATPWRAVAVACAALGGMAALGSPSDRWRGLAEATFAVTLLAAVRWTLGSLVACRRGDETGRGSGYGMLSVAFLAVVVVTGWTAAGPAPANWLADWFQRLSGP